jgi:hypothetical protein
VSFFLPKGLPWVLVCYYQQPLRIEAMERSRLVQRLRIAHHLYLADYLNSLKVSIEGNVKERDIKHRVEQVLVIKRTFLGTASRAYCHGEQQQPYWSYRPATEAGILQNRFLGSWNVYKYGLRSCDSSHHLYQADYLKSVKVSIEGNIKERRRSISDKTRGLQRDVVYLCWPIAPSQYESKCGGREGVAGTQPMSTTVHITWHGAQINFEYLPPYLTYG